MLAGMCPFWVCAVAYLPAAWLARRLVRGPGPSPGASALLFGLGCAAVSGVLSGMVLQSWWTGVIELPRDDITYDQTPVRWWVSFGMQSLLLALTALPALAIPFSPPPTPEADT